MKFFANNKSKFLLNILVSGRNNLFGNRKYKKFVIVAAPRTGSNWLVSLLNSHSEIICLGEKYKNLGYKTSIQIWNNIFSKRKAKIKFLGFKLLYNHPEDSKDRTVWDEILKDPNILIIHLKRKDLLKSYVSLKVGHKTGIWTMTKNSLKTNLIEKRINVDVEDCKKYFSKITNFKNTFESDYADHPILNIYYEDLVEDNQRILNFIFDQLKLEEHVVSSGFKKQNPEPAKELILNYSELKNEFLHTEWIKFFY